MEREEAVAAAVAATKQEAVAAQAKAVEAAVAKARKEAAALATKEREAAVDEAVAKLTELFYYSSVSAGWRQHQARRPGTVRRPIFCAL